MIRTVFGILKKLILLAIVILIAAWFYFDEEVRALDDVTRAQLTATFIELPDGVVHYEIGGPPDGEPVVLVHGFSVPSYIWDPTFDFLTKAGYRVLRFDLYGRGLSDRPDAHYSMGFFAEQLAQLTTALNVQAPFNLLGLSMGGPVTTYFTNRNPRMVKRLILVDPMVFTPSEEDISPINVPLLGEYLANVYLIPKIAAGQTGDFQDRDRFPNWESRFREQMKYHGFRRAILSTVRAWPRANTLNEYGRLGKSDTPVRLFWGKEDQTVPAEHGDKLLQILPQGDLTIIDNAGHLPHYERPEIFNPLLLEYLQSSQ